MKKYLSVFLAALMLLFALAGCGGSKQAPTQTTVSAVRVEGTMEDLLNQIITEQPVEFMGGVMPIDLTDTSEDGLWAIKNNTGLDNADRITEAAVFEPMIGSIAFSMVMVRVAPGEDIKAVAQDMKSGIDPRKWICVEADDLLVTGYGDVVMLIMVDSGTGLAAQSFVDAFGKVVGEPAFVI
ncbi:MAG: hypothetical protein PUD80_03010 [Firmicutes bacterium]|nr:hypothetical protein [Bacillota bacterium]